MGATEKAADKPKILMKRTGSSRPLEKAEAPKPKNDGVLIQLDGPRALKPWIEQTKRMAAGLNCLDALKVRETIPRGASPKSESEWLRKLRTETALHIVLRSIAPPVFAYMRVLGYNSICGKNAAETFDFAKLAAGRMHIPAQGGPGGEEVDRMVWEWQFSKRENYPAEISYDQAMAWLKKILERRAASDEALREILDAFEQRDRARRECSVPLVEVEDVPKPGTGKRKSRVDEVEPPGATLPPRQSAEREKKKPRSTVTPESEPLVSRPKHSQAPEPSMSLTQPKRNPPLQKPDDPTSSPKSLPQLDTITFPFTPRIGSISISSIGGIPREELFNTGLLSPQDFKIERLEGT